MFSFKLIAYLSVICLAFGQDYYVTNYGAVGNGVADDTHAVRAALAAAANSKGGRVIFNSSLTFLTGAFNLSSNVILDVRGKILGSTNNSNYAWTPTAWQPLIYATNVNNVTVTGGGTIDGQGKIWWKCSSNESVAPCSNKQRPYLLQFKTATNVVIYNITAQNSPMFHIVLGNVNGGHISQVKVFSPGSHDPTNPSNNTDGIDVTNSQNVLVEYSNVSVGDVAVMAGSSYKQTANVTFRYLNIGTSHGLAIGSNTLAGVQNVTFHNITMRGNLTADHLESGPLIISQRGRGGLVQNITYANITLYNVYSCITVTESFSATTATNNTPIYKNINFNNIYCENSTNGWTLNGLSDSIINVNINNVQLKNVKTPFDKCNYTNGTCTGTVTPSCPSCLGSSG